MPDTPAPTAAPAETSPAPTSTPTGAPAGDDELAKWKGLARKHEDESKERAARIQALEDRDRTDLEKATARAAALEARASAAEQQIARRTVADELGIKPGHLDFITGASEPELRASAERLKAAFPAEYADPASTPVVLPASPSTRVSVSTRPTEALRPGSVGTAAPPLDPNDWLRSRLRGDV